MGSRTCSTSSSFNPNRAGLSALAFSLVLTLVLSAPAFARINPRRIAPPTNLSHTFIVLMENRGFNAVIGTSGEAADWQYLNGTLVPQGALVTNAFATGHPSIDNYFELTVGAPITHKDNFSKTIKNKNVIDALNAAGKTWKVYAENLPSNPIADGPEPYERHHNPFTYFNEVVNDPTNQQHIVDFSQLASDESGNSLPDYAFIIPNACDSGAGVDAGSPSASCSGLPRHPDNNVNADNWLKANVPGMISGLGNSGVLIITWDEGEDRDRKHGGGHIATLLLGPEVKPGYLQQTKNVYTHGSTLRLMIQALGGNFYPGAARGAAWMGEFFQGAQM